jgi:hypothetical protein
MWNLLAQAGHEQNVHRPVGRLPTTAPQIITFEEHGRKHWSIRSATKRRRRVQKRVSPEMFQQYAKGVM